MIVVTIFHIAGVIVLVCIASVAVIVFLSSLYLSFAVSAATVVDIISYYKMPYLLNPYLFQKPRGAS